MDALESQLQSIATTWGCVCGLNHSITQPEQFNLFLVFAGNSGCSSWKQRAEEEIFRSDDRGATYVCKLIN